MLKLAFKLLRSVNCSDWNRLPVRYCLAICLPYPKEFNRFEPPFDHGIQYQVGGEPGLGNVAPAIVPVGYAQLQLCKRYWGDRPTRQISTGTLLIKNDRCNPGFVFNRPS